MQYGSFPFPLSRSANLPSMLSKDDYVLYKLSFKNVPVGYYTVSSKKNSTGEYDITQISASNYDPDLQNDTRRILYHKYMSVGGKFIISKIRPGGDENIM